MFGLIFLEQRSEFVAYKHFLFFFPNKDKLIVFILSMISQVHVCKHFLMQVQELNVALVSKQSIKDDFHWIFGPKTIKKNMFNKTAFLLS